MGGILDGLGDILKPAEDPAIEADEGPSAMDLAMEEAIKKHAAENAAAAGEETSVEPPVTVVRSKSDSGVFGKRVAAD